ncbi:hypothetical protein [Streptomyces kanamyceticus]|uniref:MmyB-like transcription regulator ligand binding domain-containing protein n=1 Tax=Streptomyces kanamyceticus TaxID=1967 RepID=A0A5J6GM01_STRKN|nr:hypothetical protein [Streptomyces kanamyceticus]QEU96950.1 hypothetical protein CP970_43895 [Streptomyces kanamyceticus]
MHEVWRTVVEGVSDSMAYITDRHWNLVAHNADFEALFLPGGKPSNVMRWMLLDEQARTVTLTNWAEDWAPVVCPALREAAAQNPADPELIDLATDVRLDPVVGPIYKATGTTRALHPDGVVRPIHHAVRGPGWVVVSAANPLTQIDARVVFMQFHPGTTRPHLPFPLSTEDNHWVPPGRA